MRTITRTILMAAFGLACLSVAGRLQPAAARQADQQNPPCEDDARFREFDFWIGHWAVDNAQGQRAGTNLIEKQEKGCLLLEKWTGGGGGTGTSMNYFDTSKGKWVQVWVSSTGASIRIEGGLEDGNMVLTGHLIRLDGTALPFRGTWTPLPDGRVRQFFEQSTDGGATWTPGFDGYYTRMEDAGDG